MLRHLPRVLRRGRLAGAVILAVALILQATLGATFLAEPRLALFDRYVRLMPRHRQSAPVVIVAIDDQSLSRLGQWPWPRQKLAALIERILAGHPTVLGLDLVMPEPDRSSPDIWLRDEGALAPDLVTALNDLPDHDRVLGDAIRSGPVVVGVVGQRDGKPDEVGPLTPVLSQGGDPFPWLPDYDRLIRSLAVIDKAASGHAMLSVDKSRDGLVRRLPLISGVAGRVLVPSLAVEMLRIAAGADRIRIAVDGSGIKGVVLGDLAIPTEPNGFVWLWLSPHDTTRFVSASDVVAGKVPPDTFDQRLVLLGVTGLAMVDQPSTALGPMPGVELTAQLLENVFDGTLAQRPRWALPAELALTLIIGALLILLLPRLPLAWYPLAALLPIAFLAGLGLGAWWQAQWLIDVATPALGDGAVFVALLAGSLAVADGQRRQLRRALEAQRLNEARMSGELEAARRIQIGILPRPESLPADPRFDLAAVMTPAREVGGDLYDFFKIDEDHLFVMIGDVSGKGVPASLFMALGKALYKSAVLRGQRDIGAIMASANTEISRDNVEMLFITCFAAILDLRSGRLDFCNAGHDAPFVLAPGGPPRQVENTGGPPLCVMEEFPYEAERHELGRGEILVLTTDGATEAMNEAGELMGHERTAAGLAGLAPAATAGDAIAALRGAVARFVGTAEPSDDLTLVALRWRGA